MTQIRFETATQVPDDVDLVVEVVHEGAAATLGNDASNAGFVGSRDQVLHMAGRVLVGTGSSPATTRDTVRRAAAIAARAAARCKRVAVSFPTEHAGAVAEGFILGSYTYDNYRSDPKPSRLESVVLVGAEGPEVQRDLERATRVSDAVLVCRDLVNEPGGDLTPTVFADRVRAMAESSGLGIDVLDEDAIAHEQMGGLLAVNRGSTLPPRFIELVYDPPGEPTSTIALVGKGITFDSGGLSIKTNDWMLTMKGDMAGAASIACAMSTLRDLGCTARVLAYLPVTDNMSGGDATRIGDIVRYANGTTVEVINIDAEGRLILADALIRAAAARPDVIVDVATLTGAADSGLGGKVAAVLGTHDGFRSRLIAAGAAAGEPVWPLPLIDDYRRGLDSRIADMKNMADYGWASTVIASLFLREFVSDVPWVHLDMAGPYFSLEDDGELSAGGTGFGVRTLINFVCSTVELDVHGAK